jgi:Zn-finger nucleic acid-binding protein
MEKVLVDSEKKITLDRCGNNCGLWFDKGELMEVVELGSITEDNKVIRLLQEMFEYKIKH